MGILRWDIFDGASREYERSKALYKQAETEEQLKGSAQVVSFKITEAYLTAVERPKRTRSFPGPPWRARKKAENW